jgi:hypothetical protein
MKELWPTVISDSKSFNLMQFSELRAYSVPGVGADPNSQPAFKELGYTGRIPTTNHKWDAGMERPSN